MEAPDSLIDAFAEHARACYPNEACGFVIERAGRVSFFAARNIAPNPHECFEIHPDDYAAAEDAADEILAIWHSHVERDNQPSEADLHECDLTELPWMITSLRTTDHGLEHSGVHLMMPKTVLE